MSSTVDTQVYVVEDEGDLLDLICRTFAQYDIGCQGFRLGKEACAAIKRRRPRICIVDLMLPDMDGMELIKELAGHADTGVIVITGRAELSDRVLALEVGADDYIVKPFEPRELVARVRSLLRRIDQLTTAQQDLGNKLACFAGRVFDGNSLALRRPDDTVEMLSASEALLLSCFLRSPKRILSRDQLLDGDSVDCQSLDRSIDIRISRIRRKIEADPKDPQIIKTVYGAGYLFAAEVDWLEPVTH